MRTHFLPMQRALLGKLAVVCGVWAVWLIVLYYVPSPAATIGASLIAVVAYATTLTLLRFRAAREVEAIAAIPHHALDVLILNEARKQEVALTAAQLAVALCGTRGASLEHVNTVLRRMEAAGEAERSFNIDLSVDVWRFPGLLPERAPIGAPPWLHLETPSARLRPFRLG